MVMGHVHRTHLNASYILAPRRVSCGGK